MRVTSFGNLLVQRGTKHTRRFLRFGIVGTSGVLVNTTLLYVLIEAGGLNHLVAATLATEAATFSNFMFNDRWTFRDVQRKSPWTQRALRYNFVALGGIVISVSVLAALTYLLNLHYLFANFFAIGAATLWNYTTNHCWTWAATAFNEDTEALIKDRGWVK